MQTINNSLPQRLLNWIFPILLIQLSGCGMTFKRDFLKDDFMSEHYKLPYLLTKVVVKDRRKIKNAKEIQIPGISFKKHESQSNPPTTKEREALLKNEMTDYFSGSTHVIALVEILNGVQNFSTSMSGENESVESKIKVTLIDPSSNEPFASAQGNSLYRIKSMDASKEYIDKLYDKSLRASLYKAIEAIASN